MPDGTTRVLVVYPFLMHYRRSVFRALDALPDVTVTFAASTEGIGGIAVMSPSDVQRFVATTLTRVGPFRWQHGLFRLALRERADAVVFLGDWAYLSTWVTAALLRMRHVPVLFWTIGWHRPERGMRRWIRLAFYRLANTLLLYGDVARRIGRDQGYPEPRMRVIYNSVEASPGVATPALAEHLARLKGKSVVGAVIRLSPVKHLELLVQAAALLRGQGRDVSVLLVGDGPCRSELIEEASRLGVELALPGAAYSDDDLAAVYETMAVCAVPSAVGLSAIQSMSYGVPVVSDDDPYSQMPEWEAIRPGITGGTYRAGDAAALAGELGRWLDRVAEQPSAVSEACTAEVAQRWTATGQARRIRDAINDHV